MNLMPLPTLGLRPQPRKHLAMKEDRKKDWVDHFETRLFHRICIYLAIYLFCLWDAPIF